MARIRTIKPEFWRNDDLSSIPPEAALLAIGLLNVADDEGYFNANPKLISADVFPLRELSGSVTGMVEILGEIGYLKIYIGSDGKEYGQIVNFSIHQKINKKTPSKIKELLLLQDDSGRATGGLPTGKERKGKEQGKEGKGKDDDFKEPKIILSETEAGEVANYLFTKIKTHNPKNKSNPDSWISDIEKTLRVDGRSKKDLIEIIDWIYSGDMFWVPNILSGDKLRKKYDQLYMQKISGRKNNKSNNSQKITRKPSQTFQENLQDNYLETEYHRLPA